MWSWPGDGSRMEGSFKRGYAHGPGVLYFNDGTRSSLLGLHHSLLGITNNYTNLESISNPIACPGLKARSRRATRTGRVE